MLLATVNAQTCGCNLSFAPSSGMRTLDFILPPALEASEPPEARGLRRDQVRLLVSYQQDNRLIHTRFSELAHFLAPGDVVVVNTSGTMNAAVPAQRADGTALELHLSTHLPADLWSVELRRPGAAGTTPFYSGLASEILTLPDNGRLTLHTPYNPQQRSSVGEPARVRLWLATLHLPMPLGDYLAEHGYPIRYSYVRQPWPLSYYQTVYTTEIGSAEMPSAGRAFTPELITRLVANGVQIAPLVLHTGVASLEDHELPYEEFYRIPAQTARLINEAKRQGKRVIAVGTTVVRALETAVDPQGQVHPAQGWTSLVIQPHTRLQAVDGLLTGLHEPRATHLAMLEALSSIDHLCVTYRQALEKGYLWHEFGDLHLILP